MRKISKYVGYDENKQGREDVIAVEGAMLHLLSQWHILRHMRESKNFFFFFFGPVFVQHKGNTSSLREACAAFH